MPITLTPNAGGTPLALPDDLAWADEFAWSPVLQATERSWTGALIVDEVQLTGGRPITLRGAENTAWVPRADIRTLQAWAATAGAVFTLAMRGETYSVIFRLEGNGEGSPIDAAPVVDYSDLVDADNYASLVLRFLEV